MPVTVDTGTDVPAESVAPDTPLRSLKAKRSKMLNKLQLTLQVPRWDDPEIFVVYKPIETARTNEATIKRSESKDPDWLVKANADMLCQACSGIYAIFDKDGVKRSLNLEDEFGAWTKFDQNLSENLDLPQWGTVTKAVDVVRAIYPTDGDLIAAAEELSNWSGLQSTQVDEDFPRP